MLSDDMLMRPDGQQSPGDGTGRTGAAAAQ